MYSKSNPPAQNYAAVFLSTVESTLIFKDYFQRRILHMLLMYVDLLSSNNEVIRNRLAFKLHARKKGIGLHNRG